MSTTANTGGKGADAAASGRIVYTEEGEMLTEVEVPDDDMPPDDDDESVWSEADNNDVIGRFEGADIGAGGADGEPVEDMALYTFTAHTDSVYCAALHPTKKGVVITGGGDDRAFIWSYESDADGKAETAASKVLELSGHTDTVSAVGFNFDGTLALTGSYDGTVRIWSAETGELKLTLEGPEDVEFAEWHSKGNAILAGSKDGTAWMWLAQTGQCVQVFAGHDGGVSCGCFTKDGNAVCTGGEDGTVRLWAPVTGKCRHTFEGHFGHDGMVTCLVSSSDGDLLLSGSVDGKMLLLQVSKKKVLQTFVHCVLNGTNGEGSNSGSGSGTIADTGGRALPSPPARENNSKRTSSKAADKSREQDFDPEGDVDMAEAALGDYDADAMDAEDDDDDDDAEGEDAEGTLSVECVGFSGGDLKWVASGGLDKTMKVWDMVSGTCRSVCVHGGSVVSLKWHSVLPIVTTASLDRSVRLWDARGGTLLLRLTGHADLLTNMDMRRLPSEGAGDQDGAASNAATDAIVTVSDDRCARVFHINAYALLQ